MAASTFQASGSKCILETMNLYDQTQIDELLRQRKICGWADTLDYIISWRDSMNAKMKTMFWIKPASQPDLRVGHVSLDCEAEPPDLELANPHDKSILTIARFFILEEHRRGGLGRAVMETLEDLATKEPYGSPNCHTIAITTLSRRYAENDQERAKYEAIEGKPAAPRGLSNEDWYKRMGYVKWKDEPKYEAKNGLDKYVAAFMTKRIA